MLKNYMNDVDALNYTPQHVANFILEKEKKLQRPITQLKLLKLVYLIYGWVLAVLDRKLFNESIQAWKFGPVIRSLYDEFKRFGGNPIDSFSLEINEDTGDIIIPLIPAWEHDLLLVMDKAWGTYSPFTAASLVNKTHEPETPWALACIQATHQIIPDEEIKKYFSKKIREYLDE